MAERTKVWVCKMQSGEQKLLLQMQKWTGRTFLPGICKSRGGPRWGMRQGHSLGGHSAVPQGWQEQGLVTPSANSQDKKLSMRFRVHPGNLFKSRRRGDWRSVTAFCFKLNSWFIEEGRLLKSNTVTIKCGSNLSVLYRRRENTTGKVIFSGWGPFFARGLCCPLEFP